METAMAPPQYLNPKCQEETYAVTGQVNVLGEPSVTNSFLNFQHFSDSYDSTHAYGGEMCAQAGRALS